MSESRKRLLFVDDEPNILEMLSRLLSQCEESWEGEFCLDGEEALERLRRGRFDTIVLDIRMPGRDGLALIQTIRADERLRNTPIVVLTGESDRTLKRRVIEMGATDLLSKPVNREDLLARLRSALRLKEYHDRLESQVELLDSLVQERTGELQKSHREAVWRLAKAGEYRDDETGSHVARVAWICGVLAQALGMRSNTVDMLFQTSPLHDIGKIGIRDDILLKPGRLTHEERRVIERHTLIGEEILLRPPRAVESLSKTYMSAYPHDDTPSKLIVMAAQIARHHHEKWDGSGYPDRLVGAEIPVEARVVALADVYDALLSRRPYKEPMSKSEALAVVRAESGRHFDPQVVESLFDADAGVEEIYKLLGETSKLPRESEAQGEEHPVC